jgi:hypothetical protein
MSDNKNNTGKENSGYRNSGNWNSGDWNSGNWNSGDWNSGNWNSGNRNSGDCNSGNRNSGDWNSGNRNSGDWNSGNRNSGDCNSGDWNSGFFNTDEPAVRLFNKDSGLKRSELNLPYFDVSPTEWVPEENMTDQQKIDDPDFHVKKGTLIKRTYQEAWRIGWDKAPQEEKDKLFALPNFCPEIFKEITGIDVGKKEESCAGKIVEIEGKKYKLTEV